jgi:hypothetical protein
VHFNLYSVYWTNILSFRIAVYDYLFSEEVMKYASGDGKCNKLVYIEDYTN